jgi:apolipoprotein N-acyltransferase
MRGIAAARRLAPWGLALAGGWLWALQFEREPLLVAPWLALAPLLVLLGAPRPAWLGFVHGFAFWLLSIPWIIPTLVTYGQLPRPLAMVLLGLVAGYLALFTTAFAALAAPLWRRAPAAVALIAVPALWVALEWLRRYLLSGFPWNLAAYAWVEVPGALPLAAWVGPWGISFLVLFANSGVALALARRRWEPAALALLVPLLLLALGGRWASPDAPSFHSAGQPVRVLQPNVPILDDPWGLEARDAYHRVLDLSRRACDLPQALVVWPESAAWPFSYPRDPQFHQDLLELLEAGCPLLLNSAFGTDRGTTNSAFLLTPGMADERYDKRHLVPFGEYVPLRRVLPFVGTLARNAGDFVPGEGIRLLPWGRERLGLSICFEIVFPDEVAELVQGGASALVTITNDAWYGDSSAPWQHYRAARFRAAENRRPLVRAAITGVSALVAADGKPLGELGVFEEGLLRGGLVGRTDLTPFSRRPNLVPLLCTVVGGAAMAWGRWRWRASA